MINVRNPDAIVKSNLRHLWLIHDLSDNRSPEYSRLRLTDIKQQSLTDSFEKYRKKTRKERFLDETEAIIPWPGLVEAKLLSHSTRNHKGSADTLLGSNGCSDPVIVESPKPAPRLSMYSVWWRADLASPRCATKGWRRTPVICSYPVHWLTWSWLIYRLWSAKTRARHTEYCHRISSNGAKTIIRKILLAAIFVVLSIALAGIYKFNFSDDDLFAQNSEGKWVSVNTLPDTIQKNSPAQWTLPERCNSWCNIWTKKAARGHFFSSETLNSSYKKFESRVSKWQRCIRVAIRQRDNCIF